MSIEDTEPQDIDITKTAKKIKKVSVREIRVKTEFTECPYCSGHNLAVDRNKNVWCCDDCGDCWTEEEEKETEE